MKIIDLSVPLNENTPIYPGDPKTEITMAGVLDTDGYEDHRVSFSTHVGTHIDAPAHMVKGGASLDKIPVESFIGNGKLITLKDGQFSLQQVKDSGLQEGDIVLFSTGWSQRYYEAAYFEDYPQIPEDIANYLVEQKIKMVGMDMCGPDHPPFPIHQILLSGGVLIAENLTNLEKLIGKEFEVTALPLHVEIDGSPARIIARCK